MHLAALAGFTPGEVEKIRGLFPLPADHGTATGRAILTRQIAHIEDLAGDPEHAYPTLAQSSGQTVLAVPMLRDGVAAPTARRSPRRDWGRKQKFPTMTVPASGSHETRRWREVDSNCWSRRKRNGHSEARCIGSLSLYRRGAVPIPEGPTVRNPLPSSSQSVSAVNPEAVGEKPRTLAAFCRWPGREKGRPGCEPGLLRPFSLVGIDAVPPPESSDRLQMTRGRGGPRPGAHLSGVAI